ncbi:MAG: FlgD immunoglobulin-like domain containing protein [Armatimonadota bacterium]|nr:FlgD immunoglobulin-like domain containing protein [Armatimonadota bacterium]
MVVSLLPGWNMISIGEPLDPQATLGELLGPDVLALYRWDAEAFVYREVGRDEAAAAYMGYGLWALSRTETTAEIPVDGPSSTSVAIAEGWNLLANPFEFEIGLEFLVPDNQGRFIPPVYSWNGHAYDGHQTPYAGHAFWALATYHGGATFRLTPPPPPESAGSASLTDVSRSVTPGTWLQLAAESESSRDVCTWLGTTADDNAMKTPKPPMRPGAVGAYLDVQDGIGYSRSLVPQGRDHTWTLAVNSPRDEEVSLRIVDSSQLPGNMAVWLNDLATGKRIDLRHAPGYTYTAREGQRRFEIELGEREDMLQVMGVSAQPAGDSAQISFTLSAAGTVTVDVLNIAGRSVKRIVADRECDAGLQTVAWDGRCDRGTRVPGGLYLIRVCAHAPTGDQTHGLTTVRMR